MKEKILSNRYLAILSRLVLGGIFIFAGFAKASEPVEEFIVQIEQYKITPEFLVPVVAHTLPWIEILFGIMVLLGLWRKLSAAVLNIFLLGFVFVITQGLIRGINLEDCGCFGGFKIGDGPWEVLWRDGVILVFGIYAMLATSNFLSLDNLLRKKNEE